MVPFRFKHVCLESCAVHLPTDEVTSAQLEDRLAPVYERLQIPFGTLERLSGISTRYMWDDQTTPSSIATQAAKNAIEKIGFDQKELRALFSCSVTRDYFEPATACLVHSNLGLTEDAIVMDISNACLGFSNGIMMLGQLIESGAVKAGIVCSGESLGKVLQASMQHLLKIHETISRDDLIRLLPTYTLGCGAVAFVMCHDSISTTGHRILGGAARSATQFNDLCEGNGDYYFRQMKDFNPIMYTESSKLIAAAAQLGSRTWKDASEVLGWSSEEVNHIFCHQVGRQVNDAFYKEMGLALEKEYTIYKKYGNLVSAAMPTAFTLGVEALQPKKGAKILCTAFGSGLNSIFTGIEW